MNDRDLEILGIMYDALRTPCGLVVHCEPSAERIRQIMYSVRRNANDPVLDDIIISERDPNTLWVIHTRKEPLDGKAEE